MFMLKSGLWGTMIATIMAPMQRYLWNALAGIQELFTKGRPMEESMNQDMKRALLGDHEAAKRLTEAGVLLPCMCGGKAGIVCFEKRGAPSGDMGYLASIKCRDCWMELRRWALKKKWAKDSALFAWNTRTPILSAEEMEMLEGMK